MFPDYTIVHVFKSEYIMYWWWYFYLIECTDIKMGYGYWPKWNYSVINQKVTEHIDIICSHFCSIFFFCYPVDKGDIVLQFAQLDPKLLEDLDNERKLLDHIYDDYKNDVTHWYYGHFHKSQMQLINNTTFKLLNIAEICRHVITDNNYLL